jgi:activator of HSP90 ATPase
MTAHIHQEISLAASPDQVFGAYMDSARHAAFTGGAAEIGGAAGESFTAHGGRIVGRNVEVEPGRRIVQAWRVAAWEPGVYSLVTLDLEPDGGGTKVVLDHAGVPDEAKEHIDAGWHQMYWEPLRTYLAG